MRYCVVFSNGARVWLDEDSETAAEKKAKKVYALDNKVVKVAKVRKVKVEDA